MEPVRLALVGCGGMGRRHLHGLAELARAGHANVELVAVCDLNAHNAEDLADEAAGLLGKRPPVYTDLVAMAHDVDGLEAADVTTDSGSHHRVATACLELGLHTLMEKPMALTMRGCNIVLEAARKAGKVLSVAENYRRDPINRLARALIGDGAIGEPQLMLETMVGSGNRIVITPWRHQKMMGTITLDAGVHHADILQYYMGDAVSAFGRAALHERYRYRVETAGPGGFYQKWADQMPERIEATGEDALYGTVYFSGNALAQWVFDSAGHGQPLSQRLIFGARGSLACPGDRNGRPIRLHLDGEPEITGERLLEYAPSYRLDEVAATLFGGERVWTYDFPFAVTDRKLLGWEYHEFGRCIREGTKPEVDGLVGRRAVALVYAVFESGLAKRPVSIAEVEAVEVDAYQREIDESLGLL